MSEAGGTTARPADAQLWQDKSAYFRARDTISLIKQGSGSTLDVC